MYGVISPRDWELRPAATEELLHWRQFGVDAEDWSNRAWQATYHWLMRQWREEDGAFAGYYRARTQSFEAPQLTNLIATWQCIAGYDRFDDADLLQKAVRAADWLFDHYVETHPMSLVVGGVRDSWHPNEVWTKFTAEYLILCLGLYTRTQDGSHLRRAMQSINFLIQAELHEHATKYDHAQQRWIARGWQSFGRIIEAYCYLAEITGDNHWWGRALAWGEYSLTLQAPDGVFYPINGEYYNTDLAPDELRGLIFIYEQTQLPQFCRSAQRFADWHLQVQRHDGAWLLTIDRFGNPVSDYVGPGDVPNLAIALLRLHRATGESRYLRSALKAMQYALQQQVTPDSAHPYKDDENVLWGCWSWDPYYDHTMSGDQVTHLARGIWFTLDYLASLDPQRAVAAMTR